MKKRFNLRKLFLDLLVIVCLGVAGWTGYQLFVLHELAPMTGSIVFIIDIGVLIWNISVLRSSRYKREVPSFKLIFFPLLGIALVLAFAGVQPLAGYKSTVTSKMGVVREKATEVAPANIATTESMGSYLGASDLWFTLKPQNAVPEVPYVAELYARGELRATQLIRFSNDEINLGRVKKVRFRLEGVDFAGLSLNSKLSDIFKVKVVESSR